MTENQNLVSRLAQLAVEMLRRLIIAVVALVLALVAVSAAVGAVIVIMMVYFFETVTDLLRSFIETLKRIAVEIVHAFIMCISIASLMTVTLIMFQELDIATASSVMFIPPLFVFSQRVALPELFALGIYAILVWLSLSYFPILIIPIAFLATTLARMVVFSQVPEKSHG